MRKTVLDLDMIGYSSVARMLEQNSGAQAVAELNEQVQRFVDQGLAAVGLPRQDTVLATTGDGAILVFAAPEQAHHFAAALHTATREHNAGRTEESAKRRFRVGAATGDIVLRPRPGGGFDMAGVTIANAVRLEAAGKPGTLVVDQETFRGLPVGLQTGYGPEEVIAGKRDEKFLARRWVIDAEAAALPAPPAPQTRPAAGNRREIVTLLAKLYPEDKLNTLLFLLEVPVEHQPSRLLTLAERRAEVLRWVDSPLGPKLPQLEADLRFLLESP